MLTHQLKSAIHDLKDIITITESDIEDIREAKHATQFDRLKLKEEKLKSFETKKAMIDHEISSLISSHPNTSLPHLLDEQQHQLLEDLKVELGNLKDINKRYAKLVLVVSNLYNTFLERLVPTEMQGYERRASQNPSILEVRV